MRSQKFKSVSGKEGWISPVVRCTRGWSGSAIAEIFALRAGLLLRVESMVICA